VVATIFLIAILLIFIYAAIAMSKVKTFKIYVKADSGGSVNWIDSKTQMAYSISSVNKNKIQGWISQEKKDG
jgi:hypothetical protein